MIETDCQRVWSNCLKVISSKIKPHSYSTWFVRTEAKCIDGNVVIISVPNKFVSEWLDEHYRDIILSAIHETTGHRMGFSFNIRKDIDSIQEPGPVEYEELSHVNSKPGGNNNYRTTNLNLRYSFDNFVVGESNQFANAAALAVAESPGKTRYNPLYIYGGVGLGKTHLTQAVGNFVAEVHPGLRVLYITSEKFTSDFINSIKLSSTNEFIDYYRSADVLLLDDIQFLAGKERTQVQFFHTFNVLYQTGKQIVLTSDRAPKEIRGLEERLLSRFHWGLVTDIQPPDLETRIAILQRRCEADDIEISCDVIQYIAENIKNNIRELEGSFIRLLAYASLTRRDINLQVAEHVLKDILPEKRKPLTIEHIQNKTAEAFNVQVKMLCAKKKTHDLVVARQVAMYLSRQLTDNSLKIIGAEFGGRDHSTVIHAVNQVKEQRRSNPEFRSKVDDVINSLYQ